MTKWVTTTSQAYTDTADDKMWYNYLMNYANNLDKLVGDGTGDYYLSELEAMTDEEVVACHSYGKCLGKIQYSSALTNVYTDYFIADNNPGLWVLCPDPGVIILDGVTNFTLLETDPSWWPSED